VKRKSHLLDAEVRAIGFGAMRMTDWDEREFPDSLEIGKALVAMIEARP